MAHESVDRFEQLILPHLDDAYTLARYLLHDAHDAQDAVQDASLRAYRYFGGYREGDARAWFLAIVRNCCLTLRRRHRNDRLTIPFSDDHLALVREPRDTDASAIEQSDRSAVQRIMAQLPVEFREVIVLREIQGLSYADIGTVVGVPIGTIMSRLSRARQRIADILWANEREAS